MKDDLLALVYAAIGGVIGYYGVGWIATQGFYAMMLPGGLLGYAAGFAKSRSIAVPIICGIAATLLGFYSEWQTFWNVDLNGFLNLIPDLEPISLIMIALGGFLGFWIPFRNVEGRRPAQTR